MTADAENAYAMCIFEAPDNKALFQHAQMRYEGLPQTALYVRTVLTVGNYDYTQVRTNSSLWLTTARGTALGGSHLARLHRIVAA